MLSPLPFSPVRSVFTGPCKITWQRRVKALERTNVPSVPQSFTNFFVSLKWRVHWKEVHVFVPKGQWSLNLLQSYKARKRIINLSSSKYFWAMDIWFHLLNMLKLLFFDGCAFYISCILEQAFNFTMNPDWEIWVIVFTLHTGRIACEDTNSCWCWKTENKFVM